MLWIRIQIGSVFKNFLDQDPQSTQVKKGEISGNRCMVVDKNALFRDITDKKASSGAIIFLLCKKKYLLKDIFS